MTKQTEILAKRIPKKAYAYASRKDVWSIPLPLLDKTPTKDELDLRKKSKYEVTIDPADATAGTISSVIYHIDGTEDLRTIIQWKKDIGSIMAKKGTQKPEVIVKLTMDHCERVPDNTYEAFIEGQHATRQLTALDLANNPPIQNECEAACAFRQCQNACDCAGKEAKAITIQDHEKALQAVIEDVLDHVAFPREP